MLKYLFSKNGELTGILKNKKIIILLAAAVVLYFFSFGGEKKYNAGSEQIKTKVQYIDRRELERILSNVKGAGKVKVFISYENSGTKNIAYNTKEKNDEIEKEIQTIGRQGEASPYVLSDTNPEISGIFVTATGASSEDMKTMLKKYVKAATGAAYNKIEVAQGSK